MKKVILNPKIFLAILTLCLAFLIPGSPLFAEWECDYITVESGTCVSCHGGEWVPFMTTEIRVFPSPAPNAVEEGSMFIKYDTDKLEYHVYGITGCLIETYFTDPVVDITEVPGEGLSLHFYDAYDPPGVIPAGVSDYLISISLKNNADPPVVQDVCITEFGDDLAGWCEPCCVDNDDCPTDGVFCNGSEICDGDTRVCVSSGDPCDPDYVCEAVDSSWTDGACVVDPPITYQFDFDGDEVWDTEWCLEIGETVDVEVWVDDYSLLENMFASGFYFDFQVTPNLQVNPGSSYIYDSDHGGPWHPFWSNFNDVGGGTRWVLTGGNHAGGVAIVDGKVKMAVIQLERAAAGDTQIETDDGVLIDWIGRHFIPVDAQATIHYCDDGLYCNGVETCDEGSGVCQPGTNPCPNDGLYCSGTEECDEDNDRCIQVDIPCEDDTLYCNGEELCLEGTDSCRPPYDPCDDENGCTDDTCHDDTDDCENVCNAVYPFEPCCDNAACEGYHICEAQSAINLGDAWADCGDTGVKIDICLENPEVPVGGIQVDLCDDPDCLECTECELTERSVVFDCVVNELTEGPNAGCCRVIMFAKHPGGLINPGECDIVTIVYTLKDEPGCCDECIEIDGTNVVVADEYGYDVGGVMNEIGSVCPYLCGDVEPDESAPDAGDCGDGDVDIFDILMEVAIALGTHEVSDCQMERADVPTGTPPYCGEETAPGEFDCEPANGVTILDVMVLIDMVLHRQDCCSYCYMGQIYQWQQLYQELTSYQELICIDMVGKKAGVKMASAFFFDVSTYCGANFRQKL